MNYLTSYKAVGLLEGFGMLVTVTASDKKLFWQPYNP